MWADVSRCWTCRDGLAAYRAWGADRLALGGRPSSLATRRWPSGGVVLLVLNRVDGEADLLKEYTEGVGARVNPLAPVRDLRRLQAAPLLRDADETAVVLSGKVAGQTAGVEALDSR